MNVMRALLAPLLFICMMMSSATGAAHQTGKSTFIVHVEPKSGVVDTLLACPARDAGDAAFGYEKNQVDWTKELLATKWDAIGGYLAANVDVTNNGEPCKVSETKTSEPEGPQAMWSLKAFHCQLPLGEVVLSNTAMVEDLADYRHFARIQIGAETNVQTTVFTPQTPTYKVEIGADQTALPQDAADSFLRYVWEGILHILIGIDHVLFVLCLVLVAVRFRQLMLIVTAFTLSHSITLALAALEIVAVPASVIEPIIALSIAWLAVEAIVKRDDPRIAYAATFMLGFVHGFGFSYVLRDNVGLPPDALLPALVAFNIGVEIGQLGIVAIAYPLRAWIRGKPWERRIVVGLAASFAALAMYWFFERALFS